MKRTTSDARESTELWHAAILSKAPRSLSEDLRQEHAWLDDPGKEEGSVEDENYASVCQQTSAKLHSQET